jgi:hypothetical protein
MTYATTTLPAALYTALTRRLPGHDASGNLDIACYYWTRIPAEFRAELYATICPDDAMDIFDAAIDATPVDA